MTITQQGEQHQAVANNRLASNETAGFSANRVGRFLVDLQRALADPTALPDLLQNLAGCIRKYSSCLGLWYVNCKADGTIQRSCSLLETADDAAGELLWQTFEPQLLPMARNVMAQQSLASQTIGGKPGLTAVAQPISPGEADCLLLGLFDDSTSGSDVQKGRSAVDYPWMIAQAVGGIEIWQSARRASMTECKAKLLADANNLNQALDATQNRVEACMTLVNALRTNIQCSQVALGLCDGKKRSPKLVAVSNVESFDRDNPACQAISALLANAVDRGMETARPQPESSQPKDAAWGDREMADYCEAVGCEACIAICLRDGQGEVFGALLLGGLKTSLEDEARLSLLQQLVSMVSGHLAVVLRSHLHPAQIAKHSVANLLRCRGTKIVAVCALLLCGILAIPWPTKIACHSELQPVLRRYVAAPHDGILETAFVESGDVVQQGQLLARLDGRQIRIELASRKAELNSQCKQRDSALAVRDVAKSQIASLEMRRLQAEIELLHQRLVNLEIMSPIDGVVLNGDLEKAEGAPLSMGQNLFEISPLDELLAEVAIPEAEIQYVQEQMSVAVKLDAFPFKKWNGTIEKIHPRAEILDDQSVFIAEVRMANENGLIKPGMKGKASIRGECYPLAWVLLRRPWEQIRGWLVW